MKPPALLSIGVLDAQEVPAGLGNQKHWQGERLLNSAEWHYVETPQRRPAARRLVAKLRETDSLHSIQGLDL